MKNNMGNEVVSLNPLTATGIERMILVIRDKQVLLDRDLATLYGVETKRINEQVKRNIERFPEDFCFQLDLEEASRCSKSQKWGRGYFFGRVIAANLTFFDNLVDSSRLSPSLCAHYRTNSGIPQGFL